MNKIARNLLLFSVVTLGAGWIGIALDRAAENQNPQEGPGILLWLTLPLIAALALRAFGGDGWKDFGLRPNLRAGWKWYLIALLVAPLVAGVLLGIGAAVGAVSLSRFADKGLDAFLTVAGITFAGAMVKNIFEEFAWRGYLTPRLQALGLEPLSNHLLTGVIWWGWHIPYWLYFLNRGDFAAQTSLDLTTFILLSLVLLVLNAILYGELRLASGTVWVPWLLHTVANALSAAFLAGFVTLNGVTGIVLSPGTDGLVTAIVFAGLGIGVYRYRRKRGVAPA